MGSLSKIPKKRMGRPMKYTALLLGLDPETLYSAGLIARQARDNGYLDKRDDGVDLRRAMLRIRITMGRLIKNHAFPIGGDGWITIGHLMPCPAWYGWRWQQALGNQVAVEEIA